MFSFVTVSILLKIKDLGHFPTENGMVTKKKYGILNGVLRKPRNNKKEKWDVFSGTPCMQIFTITTAYQLFTAYVYH